MSNMNILGENMRTSAKNQAPQARGSLGTPLVDNPAKRSIGDVATFYVPPAGAQLLMADYSTTFLFSSTAMMTTSPLLLSRPDNVISFFPFCRALTGDLPATI